MMNYRIIFATILIFCIKSYSQTINVLTPNGSERVDSCVETNITWTSSGTSEYYNIYYSINGGADWVSVASSYNTVENSFDWNVPNTSSVNCLVKVTDALNENIFDISDQFFIIDGALILLYPSGNENFIAGNTIQLTYGFNEEQVNSIKIEYSVDGGGSWLTEADNVQATGYYDWTIPNLPNNELTKIRLTDTQDVSCKSFENEINFSINSSVTVLYPNGGETLSSKVGNQGDTVIMNNGPETLNSGSFYDDGGLYNNYSSQSYQKTFTPDFPLNKIRVTFQSYNLEQGDNIYIYDGDDDSDVLLGTISGNSNNQTAYTATNRYGQLTVKFVSDGDSNFDKGWDAIISSVGTEHYNVNWSIIGTSNYFDIDYSIDEGNSWTRVVSNYYSTTGSYSWQIPNTPTNSGRLKVTDSQNGNVVDISDQNFTILEADPMIILDTPNGGEEYFPDQFVLLEWRSAFFGDSVRIDYSINNGIDWTNVIPSTSNTSNSFGWIVPPTPSDQVYVRLSDPSNSSNSDSSDDLFTIYNYIKVTSPSSATLTRCSSEDIQWKAGATSGVYKLEWSIDDTNWNIIADDYSSPQNGDHSYTWSVPNILTDNLKVRVTDVANAEKVDISASSTVTTPSDPVILLSPNGGESLIAGTQQTATYTYGNGTSSVSFKISFDDGSTWDDLSVDNNNADGSATFTVPNYPTSQARLRVIGNQYNGCDYDDSDQVFTIVSSVNIVQPNGGEAWQATVGVEGHGSDITFSNATRVINTARVVKSHENSNYTQTFYPDNPLNKLRVRVDKIHVSGNNRLRIYRGVPGEPGYTQLKEFYNYSDHAHNFNSAWTSTHETGAITLVTEGSGNKSFTAQIESVGTPTKQINWNIVGTSNRFNIDYSIDGGGTWSAVVKDYPNTTGIYEWQVPNAASTQAMIRITDAEQSLVVDTSDANFTIQEADPTYVGLSGSGTLWFPTLSETLKWRFAKFNQNTVDIHYSLDQGATWVEIANNTAYNIGNHPIEATYNWAIPEIAESSVPVVVRVSDPTDNTYNNTLDGTIYNYIKVTSPSSATLTRCSSEDIQWKAGATSGVYKLEWSIDDTNWNIIADDYSSPQNGDHSYTWSVPNILTDNLKVRVTDVANAEKVDISASSTVTTPSDPVILLSPNGGESLIAGTQQTATYTYGNGTSSVSFKISFDDGSTWDDLSVDNNNADGSATFTVPNYPTSQARLRVIGNQYNGCDYDDSDQVFTIVSSVNIVQPNGGEAWQATVGVEGHGSDITFSNATRVINTARVVKSHENSNYTQTFYPDNPLNKLRVRVDKIHVSGNNRLRIYRGVPGEPGYTQLKEFYNYSDHAHNFNSAWTSTHETGAITLVTEGSGNKSFTAQIESVGTPTKQINWNIVGTSNRFNIDYSIDGGGTWSAVVKDYPNTTGIYEWQVPNAASTQAMIRITDAEQSLVVDTSDANFTIQEADPTYVGLSGSGTLWFPTLSETLKWRFAKFNQNTVDIHYSLDQGATWVEIANNTAYNIGNHPIEATYNWAIPEIAESSVPVVVRVSDPTDNTYNNTLDGTIYNYIKVTSPSSATLTRCSSEDIQWKAGATSGVYKLEWSIDDTNWNIIADDYSSPQNGDHSYTWSVPNILTDNLKVRVTDVANAEKVDISASSTVTTPSDPVILLSPNGGESLIAGTQQTATYTYGNGTSSVSFKISFDDGSTWDDLSVDNNNADGSATFTVPNYPTSQARLRVIGNQYNGCDYDDSDQVFTIVSSVNIVQPNGGEAWQATVGVEGHGSDITFSNATRVINTARVVKSHENSNYTQTFYPDNPLNKLRVRVDKIHVSGNNRLRIYRGVPGEPGYTQLKEFYNYSDHAHNFNSAWTSTHETGAITLVTEGSGNKSFTAQIESVGTPTKQINWNIVGTSNRFNIDYSIDGGGTWSAVVKDYPNTTGIYEWQVPNAASTQAMIRITDAEQSLVVDTSDANFTIQEADPTYVGLSGSGTLWFPTLSETLKWRFAKFNQNTVDIHYSLDQGATWVEIANNTAYNIGNHPIEATYNWAIPEIAESSVPVVVRVSDPTDNTYNNTLDGTIYNYIKVTSPSSATLTRCSSEDIQWKAGATSGVYKLEWSIDDTNWNIIADDYSSPQNGDHSYTWSVPNILTDNLKVRVTDVANAEKVDISASSTVTTPSDPVILLSPNGGESLIAGTQQTATYTYGNGTSSVSFKISFDDGSTWDDLSVDNNNADGSATFTVPNYPTSQARLRVIGNQYNGCDYDDSDQVFTIVSSVNIVQPNGGEAWQATVGVEGHGSDITFSNATRVINTARVVKSHENSNYTQTFYPDNPLNKLRVRVDKIHVSGNNRLRIYRGVPGEPGYTQLKEFYNYSDHAHNFNSAWTSTHETGAITLVTEGSGNKSFTAQIESVGTPTKQINWNIVGTSNRFNIDYSIDGGGTWSAVVKDYPNTTGIYEWQVPNAASTQAMIRITDAEQSLVVDTSDANFTIQEADPTYVGLSGSGTLWFPTLSETLKWRFAKFNQNTVDIHYSLDQGATWVEIANNTAYNIGNHPIEATYNWAIPEIAESSVPVVVRVSDPTDNTYNNTLDGTIYNYIKVTSPSSATLTRCSSEDIQWKAGATSGVYKLEWSIDDTNWNIIADDYSSPQNGDHSYTWSVPNILTDNLKVRVTDVANAEKVDISASSTVTTPSDPVILLSPNGGESLIAGTQQTATYTYGNGTSSVSFKISFDDGSTWDDLSVDNNNADGSATFTVPNYPTSQARLRVIGNQYNGCDYDDSDQVFTIVSSVNIVQPNGGEAWQATVGVEGHGSDITFSNATRVINTARVVKSHENSNYTQTFYPDNPLNKLRVRVDKIHVSGNNRLRIYRGVPGEPGYTQLKEFYNYSDHAHNFNSAWTSTHETGAITLVTEGSGNKSFTAQIESVGTPTKQINWNIVGTSNRFNIDYSIDGGGTWSAVVKDYPNTTGIYEWQVPNAASTQAMIRITDAEQSLVVDTSDANFTIQEAPITVLYPNGGEILYYNQIKEIKWIYPDGNDNTQSQNISIDYSINGGVSWINIIENHPNNGIFDWTVPNVDSPKSQSLIRVRDSDNENINDVSNNFIELRPRIIIVSPNDNSSLFQSCTESSITWFGGAADSYKIEISTDNGNSWSIIEDIYSSSSQFNSFDWFIPNTPSETCIIRISEIGSEFYFDISDEIFTIQPSITILSPTENENLGSNQTINIEWTSNFTSDTYNIDYSEDYGATWINIISEQELPSQTYQWDVSDLEITSAIIKVSDFTDNCKYDVVPILFGLIEDFNLTNTSIEENLPVFSIIGDFEVDGNGSDDYIFELTSGIGDDNNNSFQIIGNTLYSNDQFDYENVQSKNIRVKLTDLATNETLEKQFTIYITNVNDTEYPLGDCNGDFEVSIIDIVILVEYISGQNPNGFFIENADVNFDGEINVLDIVGIVDIIMQQGGRLINSLNSIDNEVYDSNSEEFLAHSSWNNNHFHIQSDYQISALQLEFESYFDYEISQFIEPAFSHLGYQTETGNYVVLIYNTNGDYIESGSSIIFKSLDYTPDLVSVNSLGSDSSMNRININFSRDADTTDYSINVSLKIYPNPTSDIINIEFDGIVESARYIVSDVSGRIINIIDHKLDDTKDTINLNVSSGVYYINAQIKTLDNKKINTTEKIVVK